jgi:hypothetical protein
VSEKPRKYRGRTQGSPAPRVPAGVTPRPVGETPKALRMQVVGSARPRVQRALTGERLRPLVIDVRIKLGENPAYLLALGAARSRRQWWRWAAPALLLAAAVPLASQAVSAFPTLEPHAATAAVVAALHLALWLLYHAYAVEAVGAYRTVRARRLLTDLHLTLLGPDEIADGLYWALIRRCGLLVLALIPFEIGACLVCWALNPSDTREIFMPLVLALFLVDLFVGMTLNVANGFRNLTQPVEAGPARFGGPAIAYVVYPVLFAVWLYLIWWRLLMFIFSVEMASVPFSANISRSWPTSCAA